MNNIQELESKILKLIQEEEQKYDIRINELTLFTSYSGITAVTTTWSVTDMLGGNLEIRDRYKQLALHNIKEQLEDIVQRGHIIDGDVERLYNVATAKTLQEVEHNHNK